MIIIYSLKRKAQFEMPKRKKVVPKGWSPFNNLSPSQKPLLTNRDLRIPNIFDTLPLDVLLLIIIECISISSYLHGRSALCMFGRLQRVCRKWKDLLDNTDDQMHPLLKPEVSKYLICDQSLFKAYQEGKEYLKVWNLETLQAGTFEVQYDILRRLVTNPPVLECHLQTSILRISEIVNQFRSIFRRLMNLMQIPSSFSPEIGVIYPHTYYINGVIDGDIRVLVPNCYMLVNGKLSIQHQCFSDLSRSVHHLYGRYTEWIIQLSFNRIISLHATFSKVELSIDDPMLGGGYQTRKPFNLTYRFPSEFKVEKPRTKP